MATALLLATFFVLSLGVGTHVGRHLAIYLVIAAAAVLPVIVIGSYYSSSGSPVWILFTDMLGEQQAQYAEWHAAAIISGLVFGIVIYNRRRSKERLQR